MGPGAAISIVCKTPGVGGGKSRLRPLLGAEMVARLSGCFIRDVAAALEAVPSPLGRQLYALYSPAGSDVLLRALLPPPWTLVLSHAQSVGAVLDMSMAAFLGDGHDCAIMVNGDSPTLPTDFIVEAIAALRAPGDRVVLGPALDGGYYLVGLKRPHPRLFEDIAWSTPDVLACTVERARELGLPVMLLPRWYDVDEPQDVLRLQREFAGQAPCLNSGMTGGPAPHTRALLAEWAGGERSAFSGGLETKCLAPPVTPTSCPPICGANQ
ncbi:TIGR04282 family arsenosugar biosynthesis glycosyltransferase [Sediminicoccus rosea]|uniref:TIGR04282 family arsenosugar biosynthesis glycosyltransferase n=1 Tax=Sediminicoccus rosea TaxID=1225128 RepID=A0ABZ0PM32_9PROT|nr:TIGR04282 family arsenosugar biosynthesis glycosyltransferase [Sediminicoccus rosea]WPB86427.1 TIGR04282 family arsenosugar biosynthesis glycosyltransferase [Sediminicoccus rosea]